MIELENIHTRVSVLEDNSKRHEQSIRQLGEDIGEIKVRLGNMATKDDILNLSQKIDLGINGLLKDALSSIPQKAMLGWTIVIAAVAAVSLLLPYLHIQR